MLLSFCFVGPGLDAHVAGPFSIYFDFDAQQQGFVKTRLMETIRGIVRAFISAQLGNKYMHLSCELACRN